MKYYLHRISLHAELSYPLLKRGVLSIGFSDFATHEFVRDHQAKDWQDVPSAIEKEWGKFRPRFGLQRFLQMNKGDRVVVPSWGNFHVYDIDSDKRLIPADLDLHNLETWDHHGIHMQEGRLYNRENGQLIDLGFFRKVKEVATGIPRSDYADNALTARMKVGQANVNIDDLQKSVDEAIRRCREENPINIANLITDDCAGKVLDRINKELSPSQLEKLLKWYFKRIGASSVDIPPKNEPGKEGDADIVAIFKPIGTIIYVQAKHHTGITGDWARKQINDYVKNKEELEKLKEEDGYTRISWVVSTGDDFSKDCRAKAEEYDVRLINGRELASRILEAGISDLELR